MIPKRYRKVINDDEDKSLLRFMGWAALAAFAVILAGLFFYDPNDTSAIPLIRGAGAVAWAVMVIAYLVGYYTSREVYWEEIPGEKNERNK